ncbi:hypothetical protein NPIL_510311 [Nephila pilipes]|uniref:Uncharacterized protein n=1 Tax=Nephila pilipes TaxID=299642 RepID=A0A8X6QDV7_NEPPI|nr:hypothetical protein NPIL_510311 [Nephila pilipes]
MKSPQMKRVVQKTRGHRKRTKLAHNIEKSVSNDDQTMRADMFAPEDMPSSNNGLKCGAELVFDVGKIISPVFISQSIVAPISFTKIKFHFPKFHLLTNLAQNFSVNYFYP